MDAPIKVDVWSDIACPFCYIGKRKFEVAVAGTGLPVEVEYHSFELQPDAPEEYHGSHAEFLSSHMGVSTAQAKTMEQQLADTAAEVGLTFRFDLLHLARTRKAHELLHYAKARGRQAEMKDRLLTAYFTEGLHTGHLDELADLAAGLGFDRDDVVRSLTAGEYADDVAEDVQTAAQYGIRGVPFFVFNNRYGVSGAQDPVVFAEVLTKVGAEAGQPA